MQKSIQNFKIKKRILFLFFFLFSIFLFLYNYDTRPLISVVLPTYNRVDLLPRAIESILNQTHTDFELIIVDDASTDKTPDLLKKYKKRDSRIKILRNKKNCGIACSRNRGMNAARGKYIAPMDSDDSAYPFRLEKLLTVMEDNPDLVVAVAAWGNEKQEFAPELLKNAKKYQITNTPEQIQFELMFNCPFCNVCSLIQTKFIRKHKIQYNNKYISAEDYDFWKQIILKGGKITKIKEAVIFVRFHGTNSPEYYSKMATNSNLIKQELINRFFEINPVDLKWGYSQPEKCQIITKATEENKKKNIVPQEEIRSFKNQICPPKDKKNVYVQHPHWDSFIVFENNKDFKRLSTQEIGKYFFDGENTLILKWNVQLYEVFIKEMSEKYIYQEIPSAQITHPYWKDSVLLLKNKRICRLAQQDCGSFNLNTQQNILEIKWDKYDFEKFIKNTKTGIFEYVSGKNSS